MKITKKSKMLFLLFLKNAEKILSQDFIQEKLWGDYDLSFKNRNIRSSVQLLRRALAHYPCKNWIQTVSGEGYVLQREN